MKYNLNLIDISIFSYKMDTFKKYSPNTLEDCINLNDVEELALKKLNDNAFSYYYSGAGDEETLRENKQAFKRIKLNPRILVDISHIDTTTHIQGTKISMPICFAPSALHKLATPRGEHESASAAHSMKTLYCLSSLSSTKMEEVAQSNKDGLRWFQLYVVKNRAYTLSMIKRAEQSGFKAIVLTVDAPILGSRERDQRVKFKVPDGVAYENLAGLSVNKNNENTDVKQSSSSLFNFFLNNMDPSLTWDVVKWIKSVTNLPLILKGVHRADDAVIAAEMGVNGIIVSNHGGRQLDTVLSGVEMLIPIAKALKGYKNIEVYVDGGVRRGTDVFKCLALGAKAVFLGRPLLWGMVLGGEKGAKRVMELIYNEFVICMKLCGCRNIAEITSDYVINWFETAKF